MSVRVASNRFIVSSFEKWDRLYQYLVSNVVDFQKLGAQLVLEAKKAQALRQISRLEEIGIILSRYPIREDRLIGQYYLGWCEHRRGKDARAIFESIVENSTTYRSTALIDLATLELSAGNYDSGIKFCEEAIRQSHTASTIINAARSIAVIKSSEGFNKAALKGLETIAPLTRYATPIVRYQYLNSLAVEYGEIGKIEEASNICKVVLASPYAFAYPEWRETGQEIALRGYKSRSAVLLTQKIPKNLLYLPERERSESIRRNPFFQPSDVTQMADWKKKMGKEPNGEHNGDTQDENVDEMDDRDLLATLMQIAARDGVDEEKLRDVVKYAIKTLGMPKQK